MQNRLREAGVSPARSRHCEVEPPAKKPLGEIAWEGSRG